MKATRLILLSSLWLVLNACSQNAALKYSSVDTIYPVAQTKTAPEKSSSKNELIASPAAHKQTRLTLNLPAQPSVFNVSVHQIDAQEFFMSLFVDSPENVVVHPDVQGMISLELKNITIQQVLEAVKKVYGYDYSHNNFGYIIYPAKVHEKIFKIDRLDLVREGSSRTRVSSGQINNGNNNSYNTTGSSSANSSKNSSPSSTTSGSWINTTSKTDFWTELENSLKAIISIDKNAKVIINKQTGIIVVRADPMSMLEVENLITTTQKQLNRQVIIEAKILEITLNDNHQDGINWASIVREGGKAFLTSSNPLPSLVKGASDVFTIGLRSGDFHAFIELMESQGKTNILSSPRISTLNNQKAIIKVGRDEYFITNVSSNNTSSASTTNISQNITWTPFFSGIALDVTPQINNNQRITLHIHPSITRVESQTKNFKVNDQATSIPLALNTVRESDSIVQAQNGQIIVIGGLMQETRDEQKQGVSLLSRIPFIGNAFRVNKGKTKKSELVILLKPTVIKNNQVWNQAIQDSRNSMRQLEQFKQWQ